VSLEAISQNNLVGMKRSNGFNAVVLVACHRNVERCKGQRGSFVYAVHVDPLPARINERFSKERNHCCSVHASVLHW
jgi:hypothetical protein